jgi:small subunit ribosomal protein S16
MAVKIRLTRKGRKQAPFYHIIIADARSPRDGKFIEKIGTYNPMTKPATIEIDRTAAYDWLTKGAQPTDTVRAILRFKGVYYKKHLMRGVKKGALTIEKADEMLQVWVDAKEKRIADRRADTIAEMEAFRVMVSGEPGKRAKVIVADESTHKAAEAFKADSHQEEVVENTPEVETPAEVMEVEEIAVEEAPAVEADAPVVDEVVAAVEDVVADDAPAADEAPVEAE